MNPPNPKNPVTRSKYDAVLFDLDGVLTDTAKMHATCWKNMFDEYLQKRADERGEPFRPFDITTDYKLYVDGKPRFDGVRDFLKSRNVSNSPKEPPMIQLKKETIGGLGNRKNELINEVIQTMGVESYEGTVAFLRHVRQQGFKTAVVTSSQNCEAVLKAANLTECFDAKVDGHTIVEQHLAGKPAPDSFLTSRSNPRRLQ